MQFAAGQKYGVCSNRFGDVYIMGFNVLASDDLIDSVTGCFGELLKAVLSKLIAC